MKKDLAYTRNRMLKHVIKVVRCSYYIKQVRFGKGFWVLKVICVCDDKTNMKPSDERNKIKVDKKY